MTYHQKSPARQENDILPSKLRKQAGTQVLSDLAKHLLSWRDPFKPLSDFQRLKQEGMRRNRKESNILSCLLNRPIYIWITDYWT